MTLRVHISPNPDQIADNNGVGRVVHAQHRYLSAHGIELVPSSDGADVIACHIQQGELPRVDILFCHGLYWSGDAGSGNYVAWHHEANARILSAARRALAITVPSDWVAEPFRRDMRRQPVVIGHGIEVDEWQPGENGGYLLWNKNRAGDVCNPAAAWELARRGHAVLSTVGPAGTPIDTLHVTGVLSHAEMKPLIQNADIYLATTPETFGVGTLEALASGVPVLGYRWGGTAEIVRHGVDGWLVEPGDLDALEEGIAIIRERRAEMGAAARERAAQYGWDAVMAQYARLFHQVAEQRAAEQRRAGVSVVITNYNYSAYVAGAIASAVNQAMPPREVIVVDDGSTDDSRIVIEDALAPYGDTLRYRLIDQHNQGVAAARNAGIAAATSTHIVCLDADDELDPAYLATLWPAVKDDRALGVAYTGLRLLWPNGVETNADWPPPFSFEAQAAGGVPPSNVVPCAALFRRDLWQRSGGYRQVYAPGEDAEFWVRGLSLGYEGRKVSAEPLFRYRLHEGSASRTKQYKRIDTWHPWMRDRHYPMAAPSKQVPLVRSYSAPLISVIIPVGPGHSRYLPAALDSLLGQTLRAWEAVVVDDSGEAWGDLLQPYPFVRVIRTAGGQGAGPARNVGLDYARAPLVLWLDADDYLLPSALEEMVRAYAESDGRYIYTDWHSLHGDGRTEAHETPEYDPLAWFYRGQHAVTVLMSTEDARRVGGFDERGFSAGWEDWDFFVKCAINGVHGRRLARPLLVYRYHTGTRREAALTESGALLNELRQRYAGYITGEKTIMGCCGNSSAGKAIIAARGAAQSVTRGAEAAVAMAPQSADDGYIRMEYTGTRSGTTSFMSQDRKRTYRGGANASHRFANVDPRDVAHLADQGWRVVVREQPAPPPPAEVAHPAPSAEEIVMQDATYLAAATAGEDVNEGPKADAPQPAKSGLASSVPATTGGSRASGRGRARSTGN